MNNYTSLIKDVINKFNENEIIVANILYNEKLNFIPEVTFYKILQRMVENNELYRVTKGIYVKLKTNEYGIIPINEKDIINFYTEDYSGLCIGYELYNKLGLTTQTPSSYKILSNVLIEDKKNIKNVCIHKINFDLTPDRIKIIQVMEIIQNFDNIEDINLFALYNMLKKFSESYNEEEVKFILDNLKYKKSSISSLKRILNYFSIENDLGVYLSSLSSYKEINMEKIYESTFLR